MEWLATNHDFNSFIILKPHILDSILKESKFSSQVCFAHAECEYQDFRSVNFLPPTLSLRCSSMHDYEVSYCKWQKLSERKKVSWFTGFHPNIGITFAVYASSVLKVLPLLKAFIGKTFMIHRKSTKTAKLFSHVAFVIYSMSQRYIIALNI